MQVKYRSFTPALNPRRTKLEVPGWGGERQPRKDGSVYSRATRADTGGGASFSSAKRWR